MLSETVFDTRQTVFMPAVHLKPALVSACLMLAACPAAAPVTPPWTDEIPMCGGQDRSTPAVKAADERLAADAAIAFGRVPMRRGPSCRSGY